jgi:hypothetical protein
MIWQKGVQSHLEFKELSIRCRFMFFRVINTYEMYPDTNLFFWIFKWVKNNIHIGIST